MVGSFVKHDAIADDVAEERAPALQLGFPVAEAMDDEVHGRVYASGDRLLAQETVVRLRPIFGDIGELVVIDDDQQVIVAEMAATGLATQSPRA